MKGNSSVLKRVLSGSAASWTNIIINIIVQLALVPLFLNYWGAETYGLWLLFLSVWGVYLIFYNSFQIYVGFDAIKIAKDKSQLNQVMSSTISIAVLLSIFLIGFTYVVKVTNAAEYLKLDAEMADTLCTLLFIYSIAWLFSGAIHVTFEKWLTPFGYAPYVLWLNTARIFFRNFVAVISVINGGDIINTVVITAIFDFFMYCVSAIFVQRFMKKNGLGFSSEWSIKTGFHYLIKSSFLFAKYILDGCRNIGLRLILAPVLSVTDIALFATLRTPSNIVMQGANSISYAMQPELMASIRDGESNKVFVFNTLLWFIMSTLLIPFVYILQLIMPDFYEFWTLGQFNFDSQVFALFSLVVVTYTACSPMEAIVKGNNLVKQQAFISFVSVIMLVIFTAMFATQLGVLGVAIALLLVEFVVLGIYSFVAFRWLRSAGFTIPINSYITALTCVLITSVNFYLITATNINHYILYMLGIALSLFLGYMLWKSYPESVKAQLLTTLKRKFNRD